MKKGQTALEYLMTYGWAILIVIIVVAALFALGLTKPCKWTGTQVTVPGGFSTDRGFIKMTYSSATVNVFNVKLTNGLSDAVIINDHATGATAGLKFMVSPTSASGYWPQDDAACTLAGGTPDPVTADSKCTIISGATVSIEDLSITGTTSVATGDCYSLDITGSYTTAQQSHDFAGRITGPVENA